MGQGLHAIALISQQTQDSGVSPTLQVHTVRYREVTWLAQDSTDGDGRADVYLAP